MDSEQELTRDEMLQAVYRSDWVFGPASAVNPSCPAAQGGV
jgi:hypothetical protein